MFNKNSIDKLFDLLKYKNDHFVRNVCEYDGHIGKKDRQLKQKDQQLKQKDQQIAMKEDEIKKMQSSKFWKARNIYIQCKDEIKKAFKDPKLILLFFEKWYNKIFKKELSNVIVHEKEFISAEKLDEVRSKLKNVKVVAIITMRNESLYIAHCIEHLREQGVSCYIIDNDSTDNSKEIAEKYIGNGVIAVERLKYPGYFSLKAILRNEERLAKKIDADWFMHYDADELREAPLPFKNLSEAISYADKQGFNAINFDEFAFTPTKEDDKNYEGSNYEMKMKYYYYLAKWKTPIHIKCWKKTKFINLENSGGHDANFPDRSLCTENFIIKHYPILSKEYAVEKYCKREYDKKEKDINWHDKRSVVKEADIEMPSKAILKEYKFDRKWDKSDPWKLHYFLKNVK